MCRARFFHGTDRERIASIAEHGLLPPDEVELKTSFRPHYPSLSRPGYVYLTSWAPKAQWWGDTVGWYPNGVTLCVEAVGQVSGDENMFMSMAAYGREDWHWQHRGSIPPQNLRVHITDEWDEECLTLTEWLARQGEPTFQYSAVVASEDMAA